MKILIVEDEELIAKGLAEVLEKQNYIVDVANNGQTGLELAETFGYDLIVLDVMLPKLDGISLCQKLRSRNYLMPILLLTAKKSSNDKIMGLDAGADDYVIKPFDIQELLARIRVLLRRGSNFLPPILAWENLRLNPSNYEVNYQDKPLSLTPTEYRLLELFLRNPHRVFSRTAIIDHLWSDEVFPNEETINSHIKCLRQKLKKAGAVDFIETLYGLGYRLKEQVTTPQPKHTDNYTSVTNTRNNSKQNQPDNWQKFRQKSLENEQENFLISTINEDLINNEQKQLEKPGELLESSQEDIRKKTTEAMAGVWDKFKHKIGDRVENIARTIPEFIQQNAREELRQEIESEAHKLAGTLGIFGFGEASQIAREIEKILQAGIILETEKAQHLVKLAADLQQELKKEPTPQKQVPITYHKQQSLVLLIDDDVELGERLKIEATAWGLHLEIATDLRQAREKMDQKTPDIVLLDLSFPDTSEESLALLWELSNCTPSIPAIVFTARDSFIDRIRVARLGAIAFLHKPIPAAQVLEKVTQILKQVRNTTDSKPLPSKVVKVMVVDDDLEILDHIKNLIEPWGVKLFTLEDPRCFWDVFAKSQPDLLILDVEMPYFNGIDLCKVVRNEPTTANIPILFLTVDTNPDQVHQLFTVGGDDYISKPIEDSELVTRVISRLEKLRKTDNYE